MNKPSRRGNAGAAPILFVLAMLCFHPALLAADQLVSPTWGFSLDLPEGYGLVEGDGRSRFSFASDAGGRVDLIVYPADRFASMDEVVRKTEAGLKARMESSAFSYRGKEAVLMSLAFEMGGEPLEGWGLCVQLAPPSDAANGKRPLLLALAYGPAGAEGLDGFHRSALDSIAPTAADKLAPGPLSVFAYPAEGRKTVRIAGLGAEATIDASDAEAAKALVDREFAVLTRYAESPLWKEAWSRFYRFIYRDSYERLADIALGAERAFDHAEGAREAAADKAGAVKAADGAERLLAARVLAWVQGFAYERNLMGSDFVDLVTAATEGSGDCDSRALLFAVVLMHAGVEAAIMVSRDYAHAMGLVAAEGSGARFELGDRKWLVAETTAKVPLGLIGNKTADSAKWLGILLQ